MRTLEKPKGPRKNLRSVTLLNTIRKSLSLITLFRIIDNVENLLSAYQSGLRPFRSTADVVWTHCWYAANAAVEDINIKITGMYMLSSEFGTIDRQLLLEILRKFLSEDELRLITFLVSGTIISIKFKDATKEMPFNSDVRMPQGGCLSRVLFITCLEAVLRAIRNLRDK